MPICRVVLYENRMPKNSDRNRADRFFRSLAQPDSLLDLFDPLPGIYLYVKDSAGCFIRVNQVVCDVIGVKSASEAVGRSDFDFFPPAVAAQYAAEDRRVISSGEPLSDQVWLVPDQRGFPHLYLCSKIPLFARDGSVAGLAGVKRPYEHTDAGPEGYGRLLKVVAYVSDHYAEPIEVAQLAAHVELSVSQLQREFARYFRITPTAYIREVRISVARHLLETSDSTIADIALSCGFSDQSHFSHRFRQLTGLTPLRYRQRFRDERIR